jgi:putative glycosyltransferase (TIGR04372 family)
VYLEKLEDVSLYYDIFHKMCENKRASSHLVANTAMMAIASGKLEQAMSLLNQLINCYPTEVALHKQIGVKAFLLGDYHLAETIWTQCEQHREKLIKERSLDKYKLRFLGPSWFLAIGHIAHLDIYIKHKILYGKKDHKVYIAPNIHQPNLDLMQLWAPYITKAEDALINQFNTDEISLLQDEFWTLPFENNKSRMFSHAGSIVQNKWESDGRAPLVKCTDIDISRGELALESIGISKGQWYVCFHVRTEGYHLNWHKENPGTRNADILTYLPAMQEIIKKGGVVIRMGDSAMPPLPKQKGIYDYALSNLKSEFMDLFLCATCRFFVGTNSGLGLIPPIFGVKCAMTNWSPVGLPQWYPKDKYIMKLIYSLKLNRYLTFEEMLASKAGWLQFIKPLHNLDLQIVDNTADEIQELIVEMLQENEAENIIYNKKYSYLNTIIEKNGSYKGATISSSFVKKHENLFLQGK